MVHFVRIEEGVEGLVHVSEMDWTNANARPSKFVKLGQEVDVVVSGCSRVQTQNFFEHEASKREPMGGF